MMNLQSCKIIRIGKDETINFLINLITIMPDEKNDRFRKYL